jgi:hypothetical protein
MKLTIKVFSCCAVTLVALFGCSSEPKPSKAKAEVITISRNEFAEKLQGFWLAECIANWTGLITEMDKIGGDGLDGKGAGFYTREDWGGPDEPNIWGNLSNHSDSIDFYLDPGESWGADDDTDIEYIYQYITYLSKDPKLTAEQIRDGWLTHIYSDENTPFSWDGGKTPENFLWVSNQSAHDLMREGLLPPETSDPKRNPNYEMIDAQLTTEIFGLFAPGRPEVARELAYLPIRTTARENAAWISEFYVTLHSLASIVPESLSMKERISWMTGKARNVLPKDSYAAKMYDFMQDQYEAEVPWEAARDALFEKYQVRQEDGYLWATKEKVCEGCFAAGINFGASMISLLYGEGDLKETIKIAVLAGWDSDNPAATWGGLLGFMIGKSGVEEAFGRSFPSKFNIHRTRGNFPNDGIDTFENMAAKGVTIVDRVVEQYLGGQVDKDRDVWVIPVGD